MTSAGLLTVAGLLLIGLPFAQLAGRFTAG
jgi:hypothetical protein